MARGRRLWAAQHRNEIADAKLSTKQQVHDAQTRLVGQGAKELIGFAGGEFHICLSEYIQRSVKRQGKGKWVVERHYGIAFCEAQVVSNLS